MSVFDVAVGKIRRESVSSFVVVVVGGNGINLSAMRYHQMVGKAITTTIIIVGPLFGTMELID